MHSFDAFFDSAVPILFHPKRYPELLPFLTPEAAGPERRSLADDAHDRILLQIIHGTLPAGSELKSTRLAGELRMSRTPVVQALARLTTAGIVHQSLNQRAVVRPGAENWLVDVHRTRQLLEPEAVRACAGRIPQAVLGDLQLLMEDSRPGRLEDWQTAVRWFDQALHLTVAEYCGNLSLREIIRRCWTYKRLSYEAGRDSDSHLADGHAEHAAILAALIAGDAGEAARLMAAHLDSAALHKPSERIV